MLDLENSGIGWDALLGLVQALELGGAEAMVRVPDAAPAGIARALDLGAIGVIVPMVNDLATARAVAKAMRYPPDGARPNGQMRRTYPSHAQANADVVCIAMLEAGSALDQLDEIVATPGIDGFMIGQVDLALSMGWPLDNGGGAHLLNHAQTRATLERLAATCTAHGKVAGAAIVGASDEELRELLDIGIGWLAHRDLLPPRAPLAERLR